MAKVKVQYFAKVTQTIYWPDDEMNDFNYENLECNLDPTDADVIDAEGIFDVHVNGERHEF